MESTSHGCVEHVEQFLSLTRADPGDRRLDLPCHFDDAQPLPIEAAAEDICRAAARLRSTCEENDVSPLAIRARLVYPAEFNELVEQYGSKGAALSHVTLGLVRRVIDEVCAGDGGALARSESVTAPCPLTPDSSSLPAPSPQPLTPLFICLDKHGGRNHYTALVQHHFPDSWIEPISEGRNLSRYRWQHANAAVEAIFRVGCEELLPTALASMTAKYHREVAMRAFNSFWTSRLPELRPTAGYPTDAHRFKADIATMQQELGIEDRVLWRCR
jgi:hypothetical protein